MDAMLVFQIVGVTLTPFHFLKSYIRNPEIETKLFLCPPPLLLQNRCVEGRDAKLFCKIVGGYFFIFCQN
jgi:hypothetical protein